LLKPCSNKIDRAIASKIWHASCDDKCTHRLQNLAYEGFVTAEYTTEVAFRGAGAPSVDLRRRIFPSTKVDGQPLGFGRGLPVLVNWALGFKCDCPDKTEAWSLAFPVVYYKRPVTNWAPHKDKERTSGVNDHNGGSSLSSTVKRHLKNLESLNPRQRSHAAGELGKYKEARDHVVPALIKSLEEDVNTYVRTAAAESLGYLGDERATFPLMDALRDSCSFVRRAAAIALGQLHAKEAQVALLHALDDSNYYVRRAAVNAIGKLEIPDLGNALVPLLDTDDPRVRRTTITALQRLGYHEAVPALIEMLSAYLEQPSKRDLPVVKTLVIALGKIDI